MVIVSRKYKTRLYTIPPLYSQPFSPFCLFGACVFGNIFWQDSPNEIQDKYKNKPMRQNYFFMFKRLQNKIT